MKIAFLGSTSRMSGVEFSTLYTARALNPAEWDPVVVVPEEGDLTKRCTAAGIRFTLVPMPQMWSVGFRLMGKTLLNPVALVANAAMVCAGALRMAGFLRREKPDIVVTKGMASHFTGGCAALLAGTPCVWHVQDRVSERLGKLYPLILSLAGRLLAKQIIADAESIARQLGLLVPHRRISVIWNGVDTDEFAPDVDGTGVRTEWGVATDETLLGVIARITPWKGQHVLLEGCGELMKNNPRLKVALVGTPLFDNDSYLQHLQDIVRQLDWSGRVIFAGFRWDLPQVLAAIDVFVHTAVEKDSSPLAVVSAMAAGKAIVCPDLAGISELFKDERDCLLYPPGDSAALGRQLERIAGDPTLADRLATSARETAVREFGVDRFARRCEDVFLRVLA